MAYTLSLLDKSPIPAGATAAQAFQNTVNLARRAEALGFNRFWVAEHHGNTELAGSAPEILVAHLLAKTSRIRIGSGGVLLQHYSPFKVAEVFKVLTALGGNRVDLGIGKAPGGLPLNTRALQARHDSSKPQDFDALLAELNAFLHNQPPANEALHGAVARPALSTLPELFLLGGNPGSAALAARNGWEFVYAGHFNGDPFNMERTFDAYRKLSSKAPLLAVYAFVAQTDEAALQAVGNLRIFKVHLSNGQSVNLPSLEAAANFAAQAGVTEYRVEETRPYVITGNADTVRDALEDLSDRYGIKEFVIDTPVASFAQRNASVELLARALEPVAA